MNSNNSTRRNILAALGAGATACLAGCGERETNNGQSETENNSSNGETNSDTGENEAEGNSELEDVYVYLERNDDSLIDLTEDQEYNLGVNGVIVERYENGAEKKLLDPKHFEVTNSSTVRSNGGDEYEVKIPKLEAEFDGTDREFMPIFSGRIKSLGFATDLKDDINLVEKEDKKRYVINITEENTLAGPSTLWIRGKLNDNLLDQYDVPFINENNELVGREQIQVKKGREETKEDYMPKEDKILRYWQAGKQPVANKVLGASVKEGQASETWRDVGNEIYQFYVSSNNSSDYSDKKYLEQIIEGFNAALDNKDLTPRHQHRIVENIIYMENRSNTIMFDIRDSESVKPAVFIWEDNPENGGIFSLDIEGEAAYKPPKGIEGLENNPGDAMSSVASIHNIGRGLPEDAVTEDYAVSVVDNFISGSNEYSILRDNMRTAIANKYAPGTSDAFKLTGTATNPEIDMDLNEIPLHPK